MTSAYKANPIQSYLATLQRFNRNVRLFFLAAAIISLTNFGGISAAITNLFLLRLEYGAAFIGVANAVHSLVLVAVCLPVSALERRFGGRRLILSGLALSLLISFLIPFSSYIAGEWQAGLILALVGLNSISSALYLVSAQPFLASAAGLEERGHVFSVQAAINPLSGFLGSLLGGLLPGLVGRGLGLPLTDPVPYQVTLWISAALSSIALVIMLRTRPVLEAEAGAPTPVAQARFSPVKAIAFLSAVVFVQIAGEGAVRPFANVYLDASLRLPTSVIGLVLGIGQLVAGAAALLTPFFAARFGRPRTYFLASLGISVFILPLALIPSVFGFGLGFMGTIMMAQIARPAVITMQMEFVSNEYRSAMAAVTTMAASLSSGLVSLLGASMIPALGYSAFFLTGAGLTAVAAVGFAAVTKWRGLW